MKRETELIFTRPGETNLNHLRVAEIGLLKFHLGIAGKTSKTYFPPGVPPAQGNDGGTDKFHFAPEKETLTLTYEIDDPLAGIDVAKLELFARFKEQPLWTLDLVAAGPDWISHGKHTVKWDGRIVKPDAPQAGTAKDGGMEHDLTKYAADPKVNEKAFRDGYVTLEHTPYRLKLTVADKGEARVATAWTYFQILAKKLELSLGDKKAIPKGPTGKPDLNLEVYNDTDPDALNGALPAEGARKKIFLRSNIFKNSNGQLHTHADYEAYKNLWGGGPKIPIFVKLWLRDSADQAVEAPKALGGVKFLWDAEDVAENQGSVHSTHHAKAKTFVESTVNYYTDNTHAHNQGSDGKPKQPKGDNCHVDRGGKRGDDAAAFFPKQTGYKPQDTLKDREFPFKVEPCKTRKWAAVSEGWGTGALAGKSGVVFQPSRMAGDAYKVTVHLAWDRKLDSADKEVLSLDLVDDPPLKIDATLKKSTGTFEIWRRLNFVRYMKKKAGVTPNFPVATFQGYYQQAYIQMKYTAGAAENMEKAAYDQKVTDAVNAKKAAEWWVEHMISPVASQYDAGNHALDFNNWVAFKNAVKTAKGWSNAELNTWLGTVLNTAAKYNAYCDGVASSLLTTVCESYMHADDGVNLFQFNEHYNLATQPGGSTLNGFAPGAAVGPHKAETTNPQCLFVLCAGPTNYNGTNNRAEQTVAHEIGHCMFLAHAPVQTATDEANRHDTDVHDVDFNNCTMSYNYDAERKFCGFCLFRLRGWDRDVLKNTAAQNKKP